MAKSSSNQNGHSRLQNRSLKSRQFKGTRMRKWGKWVSEIRMPNSTGRIWLGSYDTPEKAARAYDFAVYCLRGSRAKFKFPDSLPEIPDASSLSPPQIQAAVEEFALHSEDDAAYSSSFSEAESAVEGQQVSVEQGPTFWDSVLEDLERCEPITLDDLPWRIMGFSSIYMKTGEWITLNFLYGCWRFCHESSVNGYSYVSTQMRLLAAA